MAAYLGLDTSNYTTSTAVYFDDTGELQQQKRLLPVKPGAIGQRQSDAVFGHVKALGGLLGGLLEEAGYPTLTAVGVSVSPRDEAGSYMPCFLAGEMAAQSVAAAGNLPLYCFSHQGGHIAAALFGADRLDLLERPFLAFHVSGGTTQCLHVEPNGETVFAIATIARSLDLHAGQVVDRVGALLGLPFPAGPSLEALAAESEAVYTPKPTLKGMDCCMSGLENQCQRRLDGGEAPADVAKYCLSAIGAALLAMTGKALERYPGLPLVYAGGVMSNRYLQQLLGDAFGGSFASPGFSADNAAGIALLCSIRHRKG